MIWTLNSKNYVHINVAVVIGMGVETRHVVEAEREDEDGGISTFA